MKIYVGNLAEQTTENEIRDAFAPYGTVSRVSISTDKRSGHPRGFGFVEMLETEEAEQAIANLHGSLLREQPLKVNEARSRAERDGKQQGKPPQTE